MTVRRQNYVKVWPISIIALFLRLTVGLIRQRLIFLKTFQLRKESN